MARRKSDNRLGYRLRELRSASKRTLEDVAGSIDTDAGTLSRFERGLRIPSLAQLRALAEVYGVRPSSLIDDYSPHRAA